jgi:hypothetical protein
MINVPDISLRRKKLPVTFSNSVLKLKLGVIGSIIKDMLISCVSFLFEKVIIHFPFLTVAGQMEWIKLAHDRFQW